MKLKNLKQEFNIVRNQLFAVIFVNVGMFSLGNALGWLSPVLPILQSNESPLITGPATVENVALLGGLYNGTAIGGTIIWALISKKFGRKITFCLLTIPAVTNWLLILFTKRIEYLYIARTMTGILSGGFYLCIPLFVAEISDERIRGALGSLLTINLFAGSLFSYIVAPLISYTVFSSISVIFPILYIGSFIFMPETPQILLQKGKIQDAERSLMFYKNCPGNNEKEKHRFQIEFDKLIQFEKIRKESPKLSSKDFLTPDARKAFLYGIIIMVLFVSSGTLIFSSYASNIFRDSGSDIDKNLSSTIIVFIQLLGSVFAGILIDMIGRRCLLIVCSICCGLGLIAMGFFNYLSVTNVDVSAVKWIPVASLSVSAFTGSAGIAPITTILLVELLPNNIRAIGSLILMIFCHILLSITTALFPLVVDSYGLYSCMWSYGLVTISGGVFALVCMKDTTGIELNTKY